MCTGALSLEKKTFRERERGFLLCLAYVGRERLLLCLALQQQHKKNALELCICRVFSIKSRALSVLFLRRALKRRALLVVWASRSRRAAVLCPGGRYGLLRCHGRRHGGRRPAPRRIGRKQRPGCAVRAGAKDEEPRKE
jgi:hypothetical protein